MLVSLALRSLALQLIVGALGSVRARFVEAFSATSIGLLANAVAPVRAGTLLSPYVLYVLVRRRTPTAVRQAVGDTLTERMFAIATFLVMALVCLGALSVSGLGAQRAAAQRRSDRRAHRGRHRAEPAP